MKVNLIILNILISTVLLFAQSNNTVLAKIGNKEITVEEFKHRYELTPQINRKSNDKENSKEELLYTIIAEKLFSLEAERLGFDTLQSMKMNFIPLEKMHIRDALYKKEISDKVTLDLDKFKEGFEFAKHKLFVDFIYAKEKQEIENAYKLLKSNSNFDSLVSLVKDAEYVSTPYEVTYGQMYFNAEKAIYNLELNQFTQPIESPDGWYIFRLIEKRLETYTSLDQKNSLIKKVVEGRIEDSVYNNFWKDFFVDKQITTNGTLFWYFAEEMQKLIIEIKSDKNIKDDEKITISNDNFIKFRNSISPDSLEKVFIQFDHNPIILDSFLNDFIFEGFYTFTTDLNKIAAQLSSRVKRQIEHELLSREGYKRGMASLPEVKSTTDIWKNNYLSTLYLKDIVFKTELSDNDIQNYFKKSELNSLIETQINILEILTDSLEVIKKALNISADSEAFKSYAKQHTKRESTKEKGGEFGYFSISENGEIGKIAGTMEVGDVYGPLGTDDGYSVFKLIDKRKIEINIRNSGINEKVKRKIKYNKIMKRIEDIVVELADKYNVTVNDEILKSLDLLNTQMIVYRYMGFGGQILAYPNSTPFFNWKIKWEQKKKDLL